MAGHRNANAPDLAGAWIPRGAIPPILREFDMNRDPYIRAQLLDMEKSERQRREDQTGRGSGMVKNDKPTPRLVPTKPLRQAVDRRDFKDRWCTEERNAVMARADLEQSRPERSMERPSMTRELSR